ncbi:threonine aldolase family protein [Pseudidiomarina insulisalsae]|uniref:Threonine aldolase n=1 Tax=Pseudidiomarina insulisalsae TaxID=575789 RepID=A0A432YPY3_9GAMM|nr:beta-eliminating lyase-related protein [Pseudidiomarina insulisalsae]RUO63123.1 threonine aldolase [Pseudidiomarina insulisalsae]
MTTNSDSAYQRAARNARWSILRHPQRTMAETLRLLATRAEQETAPDVYGKGDLIERFEQRMATLLGKPAALFLPSGTLAQPMALRIHCDQREKWGVGLHPTSHLVLHEHDGYEQLWQLKGQLLGVRDRVLSHADLRNVNADALGALLLELPMREIGGQLPSWDDLKAQVAWARERGIAVHFDGARLWHCPAYYQRSLAEISALADSVYVSLYKDMAGIAGAVLAGESDFIAKARIWNRRAGGNLISFYPYLLAAEQGLDDNLASMDAAVVYARELGLALADLPGVELVPTTPQAAMFHLHIAHGPEHLTDAITRYAGQHNVLVLAKPRDTDAKGRSVCEISVGRNALAQPVAFWREHLAACLATLKASD